MEQRIQVCETQRGQKTRETQSCSATSASNYLLRLTEIRELDSVPQFADAKLGSGARANFVGVGKVATSACMM